MKKAFLVLLVITISYSCKNSEKQTVEVKVNNEIKKHFDDIENDIKKYQNGAQKYWDKNDQENAVKYNDSIKSLILNSYIKDIEFKTIDNTIYSTSERKKPLFLQVTASWCAPCKFEVSALNRIVEKYSDKVDFVLLFSDTQLELEKIADDYSKKIVLVPSQVELSEDKIINFYGFKHMFGFPTNYLITTKNKIIDFSQGASIPTTFTDSSGKEITITKEEADQKNYDKFEKEIKDLIQKEAI